MSKPSEARIEANRNNAKHSRGPKSDHGKHRSSLNAKRHGLTGRTVVLPGEDLEIFKAFSKEIADSLNAESPMERQFAQTVADSQWRLNRARTFEDGMLALGHFEAAGNFTADSPEIHAALTAAKVFRDHSKDFVNLALYEQRIGRAQKEAFRQLYDMQDRRKAAMLQPEEVKVAASAAEIRAEEAKPAVQVATAAAVTRTTTDGQECALAALPPQMLDCKRNAVVSGFVYSTTEIAAEIAVVPAAESLNTTFRTPEFAAELRAA
jgi:hypothetical protein